jgi:hypothetical protein
MTAPFLTGRRLVSGLAHAPQVSALRTLHVHPIVRTTHDDRLQGTTDIAARDGESLDPPLGPIVRDTICHSGESRFQAWAGLRAGRALASSRRARGRRRSGPSCANERGTPLGSRLRRAQWRPTISHDPLVRACQAGHSDEADDRLASTAHGRRSARFTVRLQTTSSGCRCGGWRFVVTAGECERACHGSTEPLAGHEPTIHQPIRARASRLGSGWL